MDRLFLDASVLFSTAYMEESSFRRLWQLERAELCTSRYVVREAIGNLTKKRPSRVPELLRLLDRVRVDAAEASFAPPPEALDLNLKDQPLLAAAVGMRATHLLTGDRRHFSRYYGLCIGGVRILTPLDYLQGLR